MDIQLVIVSLIVLAAVGYFAGAAIGGNVGGVI